MTNAQKIEMARLMGQLQAAQDVIASVRSRLLMRDNDASNWLRTMDRDLHDIIDGLYRKLEDASND